MWIKHYLIIVKFLLWEQKEDDMVMKGIETYTFQVGYLSS